MKPEKVTLPFEEWIARYGLSIGYARKLLHQRHQNGLKSAVIKIGRKILIDDVKFLSWIEKFREGVSDLKQTQNRNDKSRSGR